MGGRCCSDWGPERRWGVGGGEEEEEGRSSGGGGRTSDHQNPGGPPRARKGSCRSLYVVTPAMAPSMASSANQMQSGPTTRNILSSSFWKSDHTHCPKHPSQVIVRETPAQMGNF